MFNEVAAHYCTRCGTPLPAGARFCSTCGQLVGAAPPDGVPRIELAGAPFELASFWRRAGAFLIDGVFWNVVAWPLSAVFEVSTFGTGTPQAFDPDNPEAFWDVFAGFFDSLMLYLAVYTLTISVAQVALEAYGWTPGKATLGLRILRRDGHRPGVVHGLARNFARIVSVLPFFLGYFWAAWDPHRQTFHDKLAHTYVVRLPDPALGGIAPRRLEGWGPLATGAGPWIWGTIGALTIAGSATGALLLAAAIPDDGASWQRFFDRFPTPEATPSPFRPRVSAASPPAPAVRLVDVRDGCPLA